MAELSPAGTYIVQTTLADSVEGAQAGAISLFGVNQGPPEVLAVNRNASGADLITYSYTTLTNNAWVIDMIEDGHVAKLTINSGQTLTWSASSTGAGSDNFTACKITLKNSPMFSPLRYRQ